VPLTAADDSYTHQVVAPAAVTAYADPAWAERCWHVVYLGDGWMAGAGRAVWPHGGRRTARAGVNTGSVQLARRVEEAFAIGDDPNRGDVGPVRIETVEPLREFRLVLDEPGLDFGFDLTYRARFPGVPSDRNLVERDGEVLTDYMNFFQSGLYSGVVYAEGTERRVQDRAGFRDRGWGLRKHEGPARRGLHIACMCEFPHEALYILLYETGSGRRVFTNGWLLNEDGVADRVTDVEHDLEFDGTLMTGGTIRAVFASGATRDVAATVEARLWISTLGYSSDPALEGPGTNRFDVTDPETRARIAGVYEQGCRFDSDGATGHGFLETGLGAHARYLPDATA
jgi:hypothetical protein